MTHIGTRLFTMFSGSLVGEDEFGNRYYEHKKLAKAPNRRKRWVIYKGMVEGSKVPPVWHGWLHHNVKDAPSSKKRQHGWEKPYQPNLTGTAEAYVPQGHLKKGGVRYKVSADYEPWVP